MNCCCSIWKAIPLAFNESMSYLEMLCGMLNALTKTMQEVENQSATLQEHTKELIEIKESIVKIIKDIDTKLDDFHAEITKETNEKIKQVVDLLNTYNIEITTQLNLKYDELNQKIADLQIGKIYVYDPTTGQFTYIETVLNNIYDMLRFDAITCEEFDNLELTAEEYDLKQITAYNFDIKGKVILIG